MDAAIRIDYINPAGVYSSHTLSPLTAVYTTCTRQPSSGSPTRVSATAYLNTQVSSPGLSPIRVPSMRRSGRSFAHSPKRCVQGSRAHHPGATRYTRPRVPSLSQAHLYRVPLGRLLTLPKTPETSCNAWTEIMLINKSRGALKHSNVW